MKKKINCWEFTNCGRELNGAKVEELRVCPAATETRLDGTHGGKNAGRACWVVAGSMCDGEIQGTFAQKFRDCRKCDFYQRIKKEEDLDMEMAAALLVKVRK
jgi:hypothetical protein